MSSSCPSVCLSVCDHLLKVCEHDILQTVRWESHQIYNLGAVLDIDEVVIDFEVERSYVKVTAKPNMIKNHFPVMAC